MKKILIILNLFLIIACTPATVEEEDIAEPGVVSPDNVVKIEVLTGQANADELYITYYDYLTDATNWTLYPFTYDSQGVPSPVFIELDNYDFRYIRGEVYRNNSSAASITLKVYLNDDLIIEETETGDGTEYVIIRFNYDIVRKENI